LLSNDIIFLWPTVNVEEEKKNRGNKKNNTKTMANQLKSIKTTDETGSKTENSEFT
jgi:hypothetical protein